MNFAKFYNNQKEYKQFWKNPEKRKEYLNCKIQCEKLLKFYNS